MRIKALTTLLLATTAITGCSSDTTESPEQASIAAGKALFEENCAACHPRSGRGDYLKRIPVTLLARRSEQELKTWIIGKDQHRVMPSFEHLQDEQIQSLADYLKSQIGR